MNIAILLIIIAVLLIALWISAMALWWHNEQGRGIVLKPKDVIDQWNKAMRLGRRSWYGTMRYSKQATLWSNNKVRKAFIFIFPKSKTAFIKQDTMIGLEHGPSSYFLANLSKPASKPAVSGKPTTRRRKKVPEIESEYSDQLSV